MTNPEAQNALQQAILALQQGDRSQVRRWASLAARLDPTNEQPWMIMASAASPQASVAYLQHALHLNPDNPAAQKGMVWALERVKEGQAAQQAKAVAQTANTAPTPIAETTRPVAVAASISTAPLSATLVTTAPPRTRLPWWVIAASALALIALCVFGFAATWISLGNQNAPQALAVWFGATQTPLAISSVLPTPTPIHPKTTQATARNTPPAVKTALPSASPTRKPPSPTATPQPTATLPPTATPVPPTETAIPQENPLVVIVPTEVPPTEVPQPPAPTPLPGVGAAEHWIDVDLTTQRTYAYEGQSLVKEMIVSTGTWDHPTVTGQFHIYVKYRYADMRGPGYDLPAVPFTMYFYQDYGLHGTYWHHNFGTPMSHGCVNLRTDDAGWLFDWAEVGTLVNVHY